MVTIKSKTEIEYMKVAGKVTGETLKLLEKLVKPGISTLELDRAAEKFIRDNGCIPSFKGYGGFPGSVCISVNDEVIHGIPSKRVLKDGDIVSFDVGACFKGYHGDAARTVGVGEISKEAQRLIDVTRKSFFEGIKFAKEGYRISDVSAEIQRVAEENGFSVLREYCGHGIGHQLHEDPEIPNYFDPRHRGVRLRPGMCLAIEPMVNQGSREIFVGDDDWTVYTADGKLSAHYENTVLITNGEPYILTLCE
ncbi:MAG: type I methionyl aminopeptidase [Clostridia bacterium]|nr:type I methionyl aminopeptidase [Clostridia bacterium]